MGTRAIARVVDRAAREEKWNDGPEPMCGWSTSQTPQRTACARRRKKASALSPSPIFMYAEIESYLKNLGKEWMKECYPVKRMLDRKVQLCFSTDAPATSWAVPSDPFPCIKAAVTRRAWDGTDCGRDQAVDIQTAVKLYTRESAKSGWLSGDGAAEKRIQGRFCCPGSKYL